MERMQKNKLAAGLYMRKVISLLAFVVAKVREVLLRVFDEYQNAFAALDWDTRIVGQISSCDHDQQACASRTR